MTVKEVFEQTRRRLQEGGIELPELEADWMLGHFSKLAPAKRLANPEQELAGDVLLALEDAIARRLKSEPLAYILGEKDFYGLTFKVGPGVLIPRPETERLVEWALEQCSQRSQKEIRVLDLGTGSGCIGLTLLKRNERVRLTTVDISDDALKIARENARRLDVETRVKFLKMDGALAGDLKEKFDLVVANPPYIATHDPEVAEDVKTFEPHLALFAAGHGLEILTKWAETLHMVLTEDGAAGFEMGYRQGESATALFKRLRIFSKVYILKDYSGHDRVICGER